MPTASLLSFDYLHNKGCKRCFKGFLKGLRFTVLVSWGLSLIFVAGLSLSLSLPLPLPLCVLCRGCPLRLYEIPGSKGFGFGFKASGCPALQYTPEALNQRFRV